MATDRLSDAQRGLLGLLRSTSGKSITRSEILSATSWKPATLKAYLSKGHLTGFLKEAGDDSFLVKTSPDLDEWTFLRQMTQSGSIREVGAPCESSLARALVRKARDNMILALELYNRPTLENRLDAFCMLFCTAWEQLLKAEIIEKEGEDTIYTEVEEGKRPKTISLEKALDKQLAANDPVKANVLTIADLRHGATHLLMPETQAVLSRLFQAGILNFAKRFPALGGVALFPPSSSGLMSLISDPESLDIVALRQTYGSKTANGIAELVDTLTASIAKTNDERYAITVEYKLVLTKSESKADIRLTTSAESDGVGLVVEKPIPIEKKFPYSLYDVARELTKRVGKTVNQHDVQSAIFKEQWKEHNNEQHYFVPRTKSHFYSGEAVEQLANKIKADETYLSRARESYGHHKKKKGWARRT